MCDLFRAFRFEGKVLENNTCSVAACSSVLAAVTGGGEQWCRGSPAVDTACEQASSLDGELHTDLPAEQLFELFLICCREKMPEKVRSLILAQTS